MARRRAGETLRLAADLWPHNRRCKHSLSDFQKLFDVALKTESLLARRRHNRTPASSPSCAPSRTPSGDAGIVHIGNGGDGAAESSAARASGAQRRSQSLDLSSGRAVLRRGGGTAGPSRPALRFAHSFFFEFSAQSVETARSRRKFSTFFRIFSAFGRRQKRKEAASCTAGRPSPDRGRTRVAAPRGPAPFDE